MRYYGKSVEDNSKNRVLVVAFYLGGYCMKYRCPYCDYFHRGLQSGTTYTCGKCGLTFHTPSESAFIDLSLPGEKCLRKLGDLMRRIGF